MNKCLASWPGYSIEQITEFPLDEIGHIFIVELNVILDHLGDDNTEGTFILESSCNSVLGIF